MLFIYLIIMPLKKKRKSVSEDSALVDRLRGFNFPEEAIPANIPTPPPPGQAVSDYF